MLAVQITDGANKGCSYHLPNSCSYYQTKCRACTFSLVSPDIDTSIMMLPTDMKKQIVHLLYCFVIMHITSTVCLYAAMLVITLSMSIFFVLKTSSFHDSRSMIWLQILQGPYDNMFNLSGISGLRP